MSEGKRTFMPLWIVSQLKQKLIFCFGPISRWKRVSMAGYKIGWYINQVFPKHLFLFLWHGSIGALISIAFLILFRQMIVDCI